MRNTDSAQSDKNLRNGIKINEARIQDHLDEMVRSTVEETLNAMLDAEADQLCNAQKYERNEKRTNGRAGHYRNVLSVVPRGKMKEVAAMLKAIHAQEDAQAAKDKGPLAVIGR